MQPCINSLWWCCCTRFFFLFRLLLLKLLSKFVCCWLGCCSCCLWCSVVECNLVFNLIAQFQIEFQFPLLNLHKQYEHRFFSRLLIYLWVAWLLGFLGLFFLVVGLFCAYNILNVFVAIYICILSFWYHSFDFIYTQWFFSRFHATGT